MTEQCSVEGCERLRHCRGLCSPHYRKLQRHGDPLWVVQVGYEGVHRRLQKQRGNARDFTCVCGVPAAHWAFDEPTGFSTDLSRYRPLCAKCHCRFDKGLLCLDN